MNETPSIVTRTVRILCASLALLLWMSQLVAAGLPPVPPAKFSFDVSRAGSALNLEFRVIEYRAYHFELGFNFAGNDDLYRVAKLVGTGARYPDGRYETPGVVVPVQLRIVQIDSKPDSKPLFDETVNSQGRVSRGFTGEKFHGDFRRRVATIQLRPGLYRLEAVTLRDTPEFVGTPSHFAIGFHPNMLPFKE